MDMVLMAAAVIPALVLLIQIYKADRLEKEPIGLLLVLLAAGGIVSTFLATLTEQLGMSVLSTCFEGTLLYAVLSNYLVVALSEEGFKYLVLKKRTWNSPHFNCQFDGVVYAVFVSLGFALVENILYVFQYGLSTALARAVTSIPGHACFGVYMGVWYGIAKRQELDGDYAAAKRSRRRALFVPLLIHGTYDFILSLNNELMVLVFLAFIVLLYILAIRMVKRQARNDAYLMQAKDNDPFNQPVILPRQQSTNSVYHDDFKL